MPKIKLTYEMKAEVTIDVTAEQMAEIDAWAEENLPADTTFESLPEALDVDPNDISDGIMECELTDIDEVKERKKAGPDKDGPVEDEHDSNEDEEGS